MYRVLVSVTALCLASSFALAEDPAAQELYKKVSDAALAAKTLHFKEAKTSAVDKSGQKFEMGSEVWFAGDNQFSLKIQMEVGGNKQEMQAICDGTMLGLSEGGPMEQKEAPKELSATIRGAMVAGGLMPAMSIMGEPDKFKNGGTSDFKALAEGKVGDRAATVIEYTFHFTSGGDEVALGVKLYVDKDTLAILKREATQEKEGLQITEEYAAVELNAAAPDGTFTIPAAVEPEPEAEKDPEPPAGEAEPK
ncbi:MAG: hypothetical protein AAB434_10670 [Planctomycetota bacterium]